MATYSSALQNVVAKRDSLNYAINARSSGAELMRLRGRYIAALQVAIKHAKLEGVPAANYANLQVELNNQLRLHRNDIKYANSSNKSGNYSIIKEFSLGFKSLVNSINMARSATNANENQEATKEIVKSVATNLKNVVKAPLVVATKVLSSPVVAWVCFTPISIGMGILHSAWTAMDKKPSPYDNSGIEKMSQGFQNIMQNIHQATRSM